MLIEDLVPGLNLEDYSNEFKGVIEEGEDAKGNRKEIGWLKELCAFANTSGGTLYVGVHNSTHEILALTHEKVDSVTRMIHRLVQEHIEPPLHYVVTPLPVPGTSPIRYVLAIRVQKSLYPPISLRFHGLGVIYVRHFGETSVATNEELRYMILNSDQASFDTLETNELFRKEDFQTLGRYYQNANEGKELTEKDLLNIGFMTPQGFLRKGALLFRDGYSGENTRIECSQFAGIEKGSDAFKASKQIKGNLLDCFDQGLEFIQNHSSDGFIKTSRGRKEFVSFPKRSVMEGLANAIGHRNYFLSLAQIEINLYPDRLEILSPGSLLGSRWLVKEKELSKIPPMRRNQLICDVLCLCKLMDHKGSGFDKIEEEYRAYGDAFAPFADSDSNTFTLTLPDLTFTQGLVQNNPTPTVYPQDALTGKHDLKILSCCYASPKTAKEIASFLGVLPSSYFRSHVLDPLVEKGYLIANDTAYPSTYLTSRSKTHL